MMDTFDLAFATIGSFLLACFYLWVLWRREENRLAAKLYAYVARKYTRLDPAGDTKLKVGGVVLLGTSVFFGIMWLFAAR